MNATKHSLQLKIKSEDQGAINSAIMSATTFAGRGGQNIEALKTMNHITDVQISNKPLHSPQKHKFHIPLHQITKRDEAKL
jgi:hypothetical protein